jgi:hypothetical protein
MCVIEWQDYTGYAFIEIECDEVVEICDGFFGGERQSRDLGGFGRIKRKGIKLILPNLPKSLDCLSWQKPFHHNYEPFHHFCIQTRHFIYCFTSLSN